MKPRHSILSLVMLLLVDSLILAACTYPFTPTPAPVTQTPPPEPSLTPTTKPTLPAQTLTPVPSYPKGGTLSIADLSGIFSMNPFTASRHSYPQYAAFDTLLTLKPDLSGYLGDLVEDQWEISTDHLSVTFHVRPGVKFQDGTPVTAQALKWNLDQWMAKDVIFPQGEDLPKVYQSSEAPDGETLVVNLSRPYAPLFYELALLEIVSPDAYTSIGATNFARAPVGSGPWQVTEITPAKTISYTRNEAYSWWNPGIYANQGPVFPDKLVFNYLGDPQTEYNALETGEIAILPGISSQFLDQARANPNIVIVQGQEAGGTYLGFNTQNKPFDDPRVRVAISYAINREEIIRDALGEAGLPMYSNLAASERGFSPQMEEYGKSRSNHVDTARQMLASLGYTPGSDGILADNNGQRMEFTLTTTREDTRQRAARTIQAELMTIGIKVNIDLQDTQTILKMTAAGSHQMILLEYGLIDPHILTYLFSTDRIGVSNRTRYSNPELDQMLAAADSEMDGSARFQKVADILKFLVDNRPNIPIWSQLTYLGYRSDIIGGLKFDRLGGYLLGDAYLLNP